MIWRFEGRHICPLEWVAFKGNGRIRVGHLAEGHASYIA